MGAGCQLGIGAFFNIIFCGINARRALFHIATCFQVCSVVCVYGGIESQSDQS